MGGSTKSGEKEMGGDISKERAGDKRGAKEGEDDMGRGKTAWTKARLGPGGEDKRWTSAHLESGRGERAWTNSHIEPAGRRAGQEPNVARAPDQMARPTHETPPMRMGSMRFGGITRPSSNFVRGTINASAFVPTLALPAVSVAPASAGSQAAQTATRPAYSQPGPRRSLTQ